MLLSELLIRKNNIKIRINELRDYIEHEKDIADLNEIINEIFRLEDKYQKYSLVLNKISSTYEVDIGSNKVKLSTAIRLRKAVKRKMDALTGLINNNRVRIDVLDLINQRNILLEEYLIYNKAIVLNDWSTNVD